MYIINISTILPNKENVLSGNKETPTPQIAENERNKASMNEITWKWQTPGSKSNPAPKKPNNKKLTNTIEKV